MKRFPPKMDKEDHESQVSPLVKIKTTCLLWKSTDSLNQFAICFPYFWPLPRMATRTKMDPSYPVRPKKGVYLFLRHDPSGMQTHHSPPAQTCSEEETLRVSSPSNPKEVLEGLYRYPTLMFILLSQQL